MERAVKTPIDKQELKKFLKSDFPNFTYLTKTAATEFKPMKIINRLTIIRNIATDPISRGDKNLVKTIVRAKLINAVQELMKT